MKLQLQEFIYFTLGLHLFPMEKSRLAEDLKLTALREL